MCSVERTTSLKEWNKKVYYTLCLFFNKKFTTNWNDTNIGFIYKHIKTKKHGIFYIIIKIRRKI